MIKEFKISSIVFKWEFFLSVVLVFIIILNSFLSPNFLDAENLFDTTFNFTEKALIALPMIMIIILGQIDISVASIIALSSVFMGFASINGVNTFGLIIIGLLTGFFAGSLNGILITKLSIPSIAVTIGTMSLFRGISYVILGDKAYTKYPAKFSYFGQGYIGSSLIPFELILFIFFSIVFGFIIHKTTFGRKIYAIGNNSTTSKFSGLNVSRIKFIVFAITGVMSGLSAILLTSRIGSTRPNIASGWELEIITSVVLGGVSINGGKGNIGGVLLSIFLLGFMRFGMALINIPGQVMNIVIGFLLIIAILVPEMLKKIEDMKIKT